MNGRDLTRKLGSTARLGWRSVKRNDTKGANALATEYGNRLEEWPGFLREVFGGLYAERSCHDLPADKQNGWAAKARSIVEAEGGYKEMQRASGMHRTIAAEATTNLGTALARFMDLDKLDDDEERAQTPEQIQAAADALEKLGSDGKLGAEDLKDALEALQDQLTKSASRREVTTEALEEAAQNGSLGVAVNAVAKKATEQAEAVEALAGFGLGGTGAVGGTEDISEAMLALVLENPMLQEILKQCGRVMDNPIAKGEGETREGNCDVVGIKPGKELTRLIPSELGKLGVPGMRMGLLRSVMEGSALTWELQDESPKDRGDMLILCDRSGSMNGVRMQWARALAAAAVFTAMKQKRRAVLVMFDNEAEVFVLGKDGSGAEGVLKGLTLGARGGTNVPNAIRVGTIAAKGLNEPDTLLITDGFFPDLEESVKLLAKSDGQRLIACLIGAKEGTAMAGADETHAFNQHSLTTEAAAKVLRAATKKGA